MTDLRDLKIIDLSNAETLKENASYRIVDDITGKSLVVKLMAYYEDLGDLYLLSEFKKLFQLSTEPEIGTVYYLATALLSGEKKSCYVMDFVKGKTVGAITEENDVLTSDTVISLVKQLASGLEKSHSFEISHGDLHAENIIINNFGYLKIIDFAFWNSKSDFNKDIEDFKSIVKTLIDKCEENEKDNLKLLVDLCCSIETFKDLPNKLKLIEEVSDYALLDEHGKKTLSLIMKYIPSGMNLVRFMRIQEIDIPEIEELNINEIEKEYLHQEATKNLKLKYNDSRLVRINDYFSTMLSNKFHQLKRAELIDWNGWTTNQGEKFIGPYQYNFEIYHKSKLLKWKRINEKFNFLQDVEHLSIDNLDHLQNL